MRRLVVVGASLTGLRAVEAARRAGFGGRITLVGAEEGLPYDRPPLSKAFLADGAPEQVEPLRTEAALRDELDVDLMLGAPATGLDTTAREVDVAGTPVPYDGLVIATGATPRPFPGTDGVRGVHPLRTVGDAVGIRTALDAGARTVVVGAGFIGSEVASAARARGLPVTVIEAADVPLRRAVGDEAGLRCAELHRAAGTDLRLGTGVAAIESADGRVTGVRLDDNKVLPADLVVLGIGVSPATRWLETSAVGLHADDGGVLCDTTLATNAPGVYAAGDVAHAPNPLFDQDLMRLEHWTNAAEHGAIAARNVLHPAAATPLQSVPYFWSDWYGHRIQFVGTPHADEVTVVEPPDGRWSVLYRRGDRVIGALTLDRPREIMKFRRRIANRGSWNEAMAFADAATAPVGT
jgi:NADPH-dependent 2,4-dienoyl-CoA reductase/sulfur reductase-like enzyme